jgi:TolB-like protein/cytochrome c-type biogenesis protein CcmH/NrfG
MSDSANKAVFLSYASQDAEAAKKICEALRAAGIEVWFDQSELRGGDAWDQKIRKQIKECSLFMPIISANTQNRPEGYFRLEWRLAEQRTHLMGRNKAFLLPVCVDHTSDADADVPDSFTVVQWSRLPKGETPPAFAARVKNLLEGHAQSAGSAHAQPVAVAPIPRRSIPRWIYLLPILALGFVGFYLLRPLWRTDVAPMAGIAPALSPARQLATRALTLVLVPDPPRETLESATQLIDQAKALDPADAEVWAIGADADVWMVFYTFDTSEARKEKARSGSARAVSLDPKSYEARLARALVLIVVVAQPSVRPEAEALLRTLLREKPDDPRALEMLAQLLRDSGRQGEAADTFKRAKSFNAAGWAYFLAGRADEAAAVVDQALLTDRSVANLELKAIIESSAREDLDAAQAILDQLPASALLEDHPASVAVRLRFMRREPEKALEILRALPSDWLSSSEFVGPKTFLTGAAHALANQPEAAQADWRTALQLVEQRLATQGNAPLLLLQKAELLAFLGEHAEAGRLLDLEVQLSGPGAVGIGQQIQRITISILIGRREIVMGWLETELRDPAGIPFLHAAARYSPIFDPLRGDPRFEQLLRDTLPKGAKRFPDQKTDDGGPKAGPAPDSKSVAVLAFANLSDDKENEYFSDGISEELLTVLQQIPGLHVAARTSAFSFKGKNATAQEIGQKLGVASLVEGSVQKSGTRVKIMARLSRVATGEELWSKSYTREVKDVFALQEELALAIVGELRGQLTGGENAAAVKAAVKGGTTNAEAYQQYLQGRYFFNRNAEKNVGEALAFFQRAVELDPTFALAWAGLAQTHVWFCNFSTELGREGFNRHLADARTAAERALALEPNLPEALLARSEIQLNFDYDWNAAGETLRAALAIEPTNPALLLAAGNLAVARGEIAKSTALFHQAVVLDPVNPVARSLLASNLATFGKLAEAEAEYPRVVELNPAAPWAHAGLGLAYLLAGKYEQAAVAAQDDAAEWARLLVVAMARWGQKRFPESDAALARLIEGFADTAAYQVAEVYAYRGEKDRAFEWLERAHRQRDGGVISTKSDPALAKLYDDPRWPVFLRELGLADDQLK